MTNPAFEALAASRGLSLKQHDKEFHKAEAERAALAKCRYLTQEVRLSAEPLHIRQQEAVDIRKHRTGRLRVEQPVRKAGIEEQFEGSW